MIRDAVEVLSRLLAVFRRHRLDEDFDDEFAAHLDLLTARNERRGLPADEARRQAILQLGGLNATRDLHRDGRGLPRLDRLLETIHGAGRDLVHAARALARAPGFAFVCIASLSLGMAAVIAIPYMGRALFIAPAGVNVDGFVELLIRPQGPLRLQVGDSGLASWSYADYLDLRDANTRMDITAWAAGESVVTLPTPSRSPREAMATMFVSSNYFRTVGVSLARGPGFDSRQPATAEPVVVLGYAFWRDRLDAAPDMVGRTLIVNDTPHVVVGIAPDDYCSHLRCPEGQQEGMQLFLPLERHPRLSGDARQRLDRDSRVVRLHGRLHPGVSITQANAAVATVMSALAERYPATNEFKEASVEPYFAIGALQRDDLSLIQAAFFGVTGMVLLVVCLNISGMVQARSARRERELSVRQAIGASRGRLVWYLLAEAIMLAGAGGAVAALLLFGVPQAVLWWFGQSLSPEVYAFIRQVVTPTWPMIALAVGLCLAATLTFGLLPALRFSRPALISAMKDDAGGGGKRVGRMQRFASAMQVGIAIPFLVISGTMIDWVRTTANDELGFTLDGLASVRLNLTPAADTKDPGFQLRSARTVLEQARGVQSVTIASALPLDFGGGAIRGSRPSHADVATVRLMRVADRYIETVGIRLLQGRTITADDAAGTEPVAVISQPLADRMFGAEDPIGQQLSLALEDDSHVVTIVGVTADFVGRSFDSPRNHVLVPLAQHPTSRVLLIARAADGLRASTLTGAFQEALRDLDPEFTPANLITGERMRAQGIDDIFVPSMMVGMGGGAVLTLAALGIYGVVGFMVATRRREIAVRVALGASRRRILATIQADVVRLVSPGVLGGLVIAIVASRAVVPWRGLTGAAMEPLFYLLGAAIAVMAALLASLLPARRAATLDPMVAMRSE